MPIDTSPSLLAELRISTKPSHQQLENALHPVFARLDHASYGKLLQAFHGFVSAWEAEVCTALAGVAPSYVAGVDHVARLERDLAAVGAPGAAAIPDLTFIGRDASSAFGAAYVIEGSMLGGRILTRIVAERLGLTPSRGCAYFAGYGDQAGRQWRAFGALLEREVTLPAARERAIASARRCFEDMHAWLRGSQVLRATPPDADPEPRSELAALRRSDPLALERAALA